jgi:hypothetical protein
MFPIIRDNPIRLKLKENRDWRYDYFVWTLGVRE